MTKRYVKRIIAVTYLYVVPSAESYSEKNERKERKRERESETIRDESNRAEEE